MFYPHLHDHNFMVTGKYFCIQSETKVRASKLSKILRQLNLVKCHCCVISVIRAFGSRIGYYFSGK